jgi:hypothetical protein
MPDTVENVGQRSFVEILCLSNSFCRYSFNSTDGLESLLLKLVADLSGGDFFNAIAPKRSSAPFAGGARA